MDIRMMAAISLSNDLPGTIVIQERCPDCESPLLLLAVSDLAFCGYCTAKREKAASDQTLLKLLIQMEDIPKPAPPPRQHVAGVSVFQVESKMHELLEWAKKNEKRLTALTEKEAKDLALSLGFRPRDVAVWMLRKAA